VTVLTVPYSTLGVGAVLLPSENVMITSTVFNTNDASTTTGFSDIGDGWTWSTEAAFQYRLADLPGGQVIGIIYADDNTNPIDYAVSAGIGGRGLIPGRDDDTFGLGFSYTDFDDTRLLTAAGFGDDAYAFEAFYNFDLGHGLSVTANAQVIDPWLSDTGTTTVLGTRLNVRF
jgi:porin